MTERPVPAWIERVLRTCIDPDLIDEILGDLAERHARRASNSSFPNLLYLLEALGFLRPAFWRPAPRHLLQQHTMMWKNYLLIATRTLRKQKLYTAINVFGLALGIAVCLLIALYVHDDLGYDRQWNDADSIYRIAAIFEAGDVYSEEARLAYPAADLLEADFPEVEEALRLIRIDDRPLVTYEERRYYEDHMLFADSNFFAVFDQPLVSGNPETALRQPSSVVISESVAQRYFGTANPIGRILQYDGRADLTVTGVMRDLPAQTHLAVDLIASATSLAGVFGEGIYNNLGSWGWPSTYTYVKLTPGTSAEGFAAKLPEFMDRNEAQDALTLMVQPLTDIHLRSNILLEMKTNGNLTNVLALIAVAVLILLIACFNFMNLATARATLRTREVGVRKAIGAHVSQITVQFLSQAVLTALLALLVAVVLARLALPAFNAFTGKALSMGFADQPALWPIVVVFVLLVGVGAGAYPAFVLARAHMVDSLKGTALGRTRSGWVRQGLVIVQFAASILLVIGTLVVLGQMRYAHSLPLGYEKDQVVLLSDVRAVGEATLPTLRDRLRQHPQIVAVTQASTVPTEDLFAGTNFDVVGAPTDDEGVFLRINFVDAMFFETMGVSMAAGRSFSDDFPGDLRVRPTEEQPHNTASVILNRAALSKLGWTPDEALTSGGLRLGNEETSTTFQIVGVTEDAHFSSVHTAVEPMAYLFQPNRGNQLALRLTGTDIAGTLGFIDATWSELVPTYPIQRTFLDDEFEAAYRAEVDAAQLLTVSAGLAVLVACLGLLGLAAFMAERRRREIGVRKVLGASERDIVLMLAWTFTKLVLVANLIAWPLGYVFARTWLADFAYQVPIHAGWFLGAGVLALLVAGITVSLQAFWAARVDPVRALQYE
ncbi:MAG: ABC transporter permease [Rhodothermales bacterium]